MDLDEILVDDLFLEQELLDLVTVVSLELDNLAVLVVAHDGSIAVESLLEVLQKLLDLDAIQVRVQTLDCGPRLATITLLNANV